MKVIFIYISQKFVRSPLKISLISQISTKSLWHVWKYNILKFFSWTNRPIYLKFGRKYQSDADQK